MGTLRTLFAIAVIFAHSIGFVFVGGTNAVQLFYMISGFLISYVLLEKKTYGSVSVFYLNRFLRLFPIYFAVALLSLLYFITAKSLPSEEFFAVWRTAPWGARVLLAVSNATMLFQDWVMFLGVADGNLVIVTDFMKSDVRLYQGLLVPQAWTLGLELSFYLIAPFVLPRRYLLLVLVCLSIVFRLYLIDIGIGRADPWTYRFFPNELLLFLLGALAHQILLPLYRRFPLARLAQSAKFATWGMIALTVTYWLFPAPEVIRKIFIFAIFWIALPLTFIFQNDRKWDRWIGELSFPIYICHVLVIDLLSTGLAKFDIDNKISLGLIAVPVSIAFAVILNLFVSRPVELIRGKIRAGFSASISIPDLMRNVATVDRNAS